jgi:DNA-binding PadR family transcriptional regulator
MGGGVNEDRRASDLLPLTPLSHAILVALAEGDRHGYAIVQEIHRQSEGVLDPGTGTLYAALQRMAADGLIADSDRLPARDEDQRRKYYRLTKLGREVAIAEAARLQRLLGIAGTRGMLPDGAA